MSNDKWLPMDTTPKDGTEIIILFDSASVDVVRLCWWDDGTPQPWNGIDEQRSDDIGWWSYRHSVTQEKIEIMEPIGWMAMPER